MAGHRDDGTFAEDKAHHPGRKVSRYILDRLAPNRVVVNEERSVRDEYGAPNPGYSTVVSPVWASRPYFTERGVTKKRNEVEGRLDPRLRGEYETRFVNVTETGSQDPLLKSLRYPNESVAEPEVVDDYPSLSKDYPKRRKEDWKA